VSRWFRHYAGLCRDDKLVRVALRCKQSIERVVWIWSAILESAGELDDGGRYDFDVDEAAYFLRADEADVRNILVCLEALGRLDGGAVVKWGDRQFQSDRSSERQKRYRERKKAQLDGDENVTQNVTVTSPSRQRDAPETDTDTERKKPKPDGFGRDEPVAAPEVVPKAFPLEEPLPDPKQRLWGEGVQALVAMGVGEKQARPIIGRWLRDCGDDAMRVLDAIQRAREHAPMAPVPWITAGFTKAKSNRKASDERKAALQDAIGPTLYEVAAQRRRESANGFGCGPALALERPS
jgi:hypothetical protein